MLAIERQLRKGRVACCQKPNATSEPKYIRAPLNQEVPLGPKGCHAACSGSLTAYGCAEAASLAEGLLKAKFQLRGFLGVVFRFH